MIFDKSYPTQQAMEYPSHTEMKPGEIENRVAIITGSSRGIGAEIAKTLAKNKIKVVINYNKSEDQANKLKKKIEEAGGECLLVKANLRKENEILNIIKKTIEAYNRLDIIINNASEKINIKEIQDLAWEDFETHIDLQVKAPFLLVKNSLEYLKKSPDPRIINIITSGVLEKPASKMGDYLTAKSALLALSKIFAVDLAKFNIKVNMVSPDLVDTELTSFIPPRMKELIAANKPLKRLTTKEDIANVVLYLCSPESKSLSGAHLPGSDNLVIG
ncbi:MAG: SDR family oxidoreductase [Nanoarchaeota archaeon]